MRSCAVWIIGKIVVFVTKSLETAVNVLLKHSEQLHASFLPTMLLPFRHDAHEHIKVQLPNQCPQSQAALASSSFL